MAPKAYVVIDYQNIHLTGHGLWCAESEPAHLCLVHPLHFATQLLQQRNLILRLLAENRGDPFEPAALERVVAFRGQPSNVRDPHNYRRTQAQRSEWTRDDRCQVRYRTLKYYRDGQIHEKGIDVLVALELVQLAAAASNSPGDVVILAAHDTDQEPALEMAVRLAEGQIETAGWSGAKQLRVPGVRTWHTTLDDGHFERCRDRKDYR